MASAPTWSGAQPAAQSTSPPAAPPAVSGTFEEELLRLFAGQNRYIPVPAFCVCAVIAALNASQFHARPALLAAVAAWLAVVGMMLVSRSRLLGRLAREQGPPGPRLRKAVVISAAQGVAHALSLALFWQLSDLQRALHTALLLGLAMGSVACTSGHRAVLAAYVFPVLGTLTAAWALAPASEALTPWANLATGFAVVLFGVVVLAQGDDVYRLFRDSFHIRLEQVSLNERLQRALEQARIADRAKARFLASASHDLRQPLHTVSLFAAALALRPLDGVARELAGQINAALQVLTCELDALLDISRLDAGSVAVSAGPVSARTFLSRMHERYAPVAAARAVRLAVAIDGDPVLHSDEVLLARAAGNLIDNALKYAPGGTVTLSACTCGDSVALHVGDTGIGIPVAEQERVFEEFYQLHNPERDRGKGLGLGLAIVNRLVPLLGGRLEMVSRPGAGTDFYLFLPRAPTAPAPAAAGVTAAALRGLRILVVDDEASVRHAMSTLLEALGAHVMQADGPDSASASFAQAAPDLVLADMRLRTGDGIGVVDTLRRQRPALPALLISGDTSPERVSAARRAGIAMLHKPVTVNRLLEAVMGLDPPLPQRAS